MVVDACQGRFRRETLTTALENGVVVLYTGSKFYRGPPFSGAVFVPKETMLRLQELKDPIIPKGLFTFIGRSELPKELVSWRTQLPESVNIGLVLRWEAALAEIEATLAIDEDERMSLIKQWRQRLVELIERRAPCLNYFSEAQDTDSIVSVRVRNPFQEQESRPWLKKAELALIFKAMTLDLSSEFKDLDQSIISRKCFMGQPVLISKDEAVLRVALGSDSLR